MNTISMEKMEELKTYPLSYRLKMLRGLGGYNQQQFADLIDIKKATVSTWERGSSQPSIISLMKIIQVFNLPCDFFMDVVENMNGQEKKN